MEAEKVTLLIRSDAMQENDLKFVILRRDSAPADICKRHWNYFFFKTFFSAASFVL